MRPLGASPVARVTLGDGSSIPRGLVPVQPVIDWPATASTPGRRAEVAVPGVLVWVLEEGPRETLGRLFEGTPPREES